VVDHSEVAKSSWESGDMQIQAKELMKVYKNGVAAVNKNSFCVAKGEVFGLLGPNGAGKSSMFNMMTMDLQRSSGDVRILNKDLDELKVVEDGNRMGMCPQFNPIWDNMTVDQCINYIAKVKGLPSQAEIQF